MSNTKEGSKYLKPGNDPLDISLKKKKKQEVKHRVFINVSELKAAKLIL